MKPFFTLIILLSFSIITQAETKCGELVQDLKSLQVAQKSVMESVLKKNEVLAESLENYWKTVLVLKRSDLQKTTVSIRQSEAANAKMISRLNQLTAELVVQVSKCLVENK